MHSVCRFIRKYEPRHCQKFSTLLLTHLPVNFLISLLSDALHIHFAGALYIISRRADVPMNIVIFVVSRQAHHHYIPYVF